MVVLPFQDNFPRNGEIGRKTVFDTLNVAPHFAPPSRHTHTMEQCRAKKSVLKQTNKQTKVAKVFREIRVPQVHLVTNAEPSIKWMANRKSQKFGAIRGG